MSSLATPLYSLHLETSTAYGGVCLLKNDQILAKVESMEQRSHSEFLHPAIENVLNSQDLSLEDISFFGCGIGPGSFTGIRIAVGAAKSYSYLLKKPLVEVTSLETLAYQTKFLGAGPKRALTIINAFKNMVYFNLFELDGGIPKPLLKNDAVFVKNLDQVLPLDEEFWIVGDGFRVYEKYLPNSVKVLGQRPEGDQNSINFDYPLVSSMGELAHLKCLLGQTKDWTSILPLYIRASEAEENKRGIKYIPL